MNDEASDKSAEGRTDAFFVLVRSMTACFRSGLGLVGRVERAWLCLFWGSEPAHDVGFVFRFGD